MEPALQNTADLSVMLDEPIKLQLSAEEIELRPLRLRQFGQLLGVLPPVLAKVFGTFDGFAEWAKANGLLNEQNELRISVRSMGPVIEQALGRSMVLPEIFEKLIEAMSIASGREQRWVADLNLADSTVLAAKLWELNADFFGRSVWPAVMKSLLSPPSGKSSIVPLKPRRNIDSPAGRESSSG
jgi:hypothetical protein